MRLLLDAHISARRVAPVLRDSGYDVLAVDEERGLDGWTDQRLLELATAEGRVMVTFNVGDFSRLARTWAEAGRSHAGCLILVGIGHGEFALIIRRLEVVFGERPDQEAWKDLVVLAGRHGP